jgi:DtxR family Mn-dependent transcriptional regulator
VSTSAIADRLGVSPASVTSMIKRLSEQGFVTYQRYQGVALTEQGELLALEVIRHHRRSTPRPRYSSTSSPKTWKTG